MAYSPPEALFEKTPLIVDPSFDIWQLGIVFYFIWRSNDVPWEDDMEKVMENKKNKGILPTDSLHYKNIQALENNKFRNDQLGLPNSDPMKTIIEGMLEFNPKKRPSIDQIVQELSLIRQKTLYIALDSPSSK